MVELQPTDVEVPMVGSLINPAWACEAMPATPNANIAEQNAFDSMENPPIFVGDARQRSRERMV
jgi:hypothetical protein